MREPASAAAGIRYNNHVLPSLRNRCVTITQEISVLARMIVSHLIFCQTCENFVASTPRTQDTDPLPFSKRLSVSAWAFSLSPQTHNRHKNYFFCKMCLEMKSESKQIPQTHSVVMCCFGTCFFSSWACRHQVVHCLWSHGKKVEFFFWRPTYPTRLGSDCLEVGWQGSKLARTLTHMNKAHGFAASWHTVRTRRQNQRKSLELFVHLVRKKKYKDVAHWYRSSLVSLDWAPISKRLISKRW